MATQNINLNNVDAVKYQGQDVSEVKLNGQTIWIQPIETPGNFRVSEYQRPIEVIDHESATFMWDKQSAAVGYRIRYASKEVMRNQNNPVVVDLPADTNSYMVDKFPLLGGAYGQVNPYTSLRKENISIHGFVTVYAQICAKTSTGEFTPWSRELRWQVPHDFFWKPIYVTNKYDASGTGKKLHISIQWDDHGGTNSYHGIAIERSTNNKTWTQINPSKGPGMLQTIDGDVNEFIDTNVVPGVTYYYRMASEIIEPATRPRLQYPTGQKGRPTKVAKIKCAMHQPMHLVYKLVNKVTLPIESSLPGGTVKIDWGDGTFTNWDNSSWRKSPHGTSRPHEWNTITKTYSDTKDRIIRVYGDVINMGVGWRSSSKAANTAKVAESNKSLFKCSTFGDLALRQLNNMFYDAINLEQVPSKIPIGCRRFKQMFYNAKTEAGDPGSTHRTYLDLSSWDMKWAENLEFMFASCSTLISLNLSGWDVRFAHKFTSMFMSMTELTSLNLTGWKTFAPMWLKDDTTNERAFTSMFRDCHKITQINFPKVTSYYNYQNRTHGANRCQNMFNNCYELESISGIENWDVSTLAPHWGAYGMFKNCRKLNADLSSWCSLEFVPAGHSDVWLKEFAWDTQANQYVPFWQNEDNRFKWGECVPSCAERSTWDENCQKI